MKVSRKKKQLLKLSRKHSIRNKILNPVIVKTLMKRKPISLKSCKEDKGNTKTNCPSNALIVERLGISKTSVLILKRTMKIKEAQLKHSRKGKNLLIRKTTTKERISTLKKKKATQMNPVIVMKKKSSF